MNWPQLAYEYLVGGLFFAVTLFLCFRPGAANRKNYSDRRTLTICLVGFSGYLVIHVGWIMAATG